MPIDTTANHYLLLRLIACIHLEPSYTARIAELTTRGIDWKQFVEAAELHGLSPLAHKYLAAAGGAAPSATLDQLFALYLRHKSSLRIRVDAVTEILQRLEHQGIPVVLLKGIALAHLMYDEPGHRPMRDIDILVAPEQKHPVFGLLKQMGYRQYGDLGLRADHHHLPTLGKTLAGLTVSVEIHDDAIAPDNIGSIRLDNLTDTPQSIRFDQTAARCLGHIDMLRHLCRHTLEPRRMTKLGSVLDTLGYAARFAEAIDWVRLRSDFPDTLSTLKNFSYLLVWPSRLGQSVCGPKPPPPDGVGLGMLPLSRIRGEPAKIRHLLNPSDWWLRGYYGVPADQTLLCTKLIRHPRQLARWGWRRFRPWRRLGFGPKSRV